MDGSLLYSRYLNQLNKTKQAFGFYSETEQNLVETDPFYINRPEAISMMALIDTIAPHIDDHPPTSEPTHDYKHKYEKMMKALIDLISNSNNKSATYLATSIADIIKRN